MSASTMGTPSITPDARVAPTQPAAPAALSPNARAPSLQPGGATGGFGTAETQSPAARAQPTNGSGARAPQSLEQPVLGSESVSSFLSGAAIFTHADALYFLGESLAGMPSSQAQPRWPVDLKLLPINVRPENVPDLGPQFHPFDPYFVRRDFPILQEQTRTALLRPYFSFPQLRTCCRKCLP
jgi:cysteine desulfurase/selenocysteine lyase